MLENSNSKRPIVYLRDISPTNWEHPADRLALTALKQIPGLDELLKNLIGNTTERSLRLLALASSVRVSEKQFPTINRLFNECCSRLDIHSIPELFIAQSPFLNAGAIGVNKPFIILNSSLLKELNENEIMAVLGHELGHCLSGHSLYRTVLWLLMNIPFMLFNIPFANLAFRLLILTLLEWNRKSELSADRAGLLTTQSPEVCYTLEMKMAGGSQIEQMNINDFFLQAQEYENASDIIDSIFKITNLSQESHPFAVLRLIELKKWVDKGDYENILNGNYKRRYDEKEEIDINKAFKKAEESYKEDIKTSSDPLAKAVKQIIENIEPITKQINDFFGNLFNSKLF